MINIKELIEKKKKLDKLIELIEWAEKEGLVSHEFCESQSTIASHIESETPCEVAESQRSSKSHREDASQNIDRAQGLSAKEKSHRKFESHIYNAKKESHSDSESQIDSAKELQPIIPQTNRRALIKVFELEDRLILEWWIAGKKTSEVSLKDDFTLYRLMKNLAEDGILPFSVFWQEIRRYNAMDTNKAYLLFNYIGCSEKFNVSMDKIKRKDGVLETSEWCLIFEEDFDDVIEDFSPSPEQMREYWGDLLG